MLAQFSDDGNQMKKVSFHEISRCNNTVTNSVNYQGKRGKKKN